MKQTANAKQQNHAVFARINRTVAPTGGSWWAGHAREGFTACAESRFKAKHETAYAFIQDAALPQRARGPHRPVVEPISSYTFSQSDLAELQADTLQRHADAVESSDTETE